MRREEEEEGRLLRERLGGRGEREEDNTEVDRRSTSGSSDNFTIFEYSLGLLENEEEIRGEQKTEPRSFLCCD